MVNIICEYDFYFILLQQKGCEKCWLKKGLHFVVCAGLKCRSHHQSATGNLEVCTPKFDFIHLLGPLLAPFCHFCLCQGISWLIFISRVRTGNYVCHVVRPASSATKSLYTLLHWHCPATWPTLIQERPRSGRDWYETNVNQRIAMRPNVHDSRRLHGAWILPVTCLWQPFASLVLLPQNSVIAQWHQFFINKSEKFNVGVKWCEECKYKIWVGNALIYKL